MSLSIEENFEFAQKCERFVPTVSTKTNKISFLFLSIIHSPRRKTSVNTLSQIKK